MALRITNAITQRINKITIATIRYFMAELHNLGIEREM